MRFVLAALGVVLALGVHLGSAATETVVMGDNFFFNAASGTRVVTVNVGDRVTWENRGEQYHDATSDSPGWGSGTLAPGETWSRTFTDPGIYSYTCRLHEAEDMTGRVVVVGTPATPVSRVLIPIADRAYRAR